MHVLLRKDGNYKKNKGTRQTSYRLHILVGFISAVVGNMWKPRHVIYWLSFSSLIATCSAQRRCLTTSDSKDPSKRCIFPFTFKGVTYNGCPIDLIDKDRRWCSTKVDSRGNHVTGEDKYGFCSSNCPKHNERRVQQVANRGQPKRIESKDPFEKCVTKGGKAGSGVKCQIPFIYKGIQYWGCPVDLVDKSETWCSTKVDDKGQHISGIDAYGFCSSACPKHDEGKAPLNAPESCANAGDECRPTIVCSAQFSKASDLERRVCKQADGSRGTCCKDITKISSPNILPDRKTFGLRQVGDLGTLAPSLVTRAADDGSELANNVTNARVKTLRSKTSSSGQHALNQRQSPGVANIGRSGFAFMDAGRFISLSNRQFGGLTEFSNADFDNTVLENACPAEPFCNANDKYRSIDGSCNNLKEPLYGKSFTALNRVIDSDYADGFSEPRVAKDGNDLPSSRLISTLTRFNAPNEDTEITALLVAFGQYLDHDLDHVPISQSNGEPIECCTEDGDFIDPKNLPKEERLLCNPIQVPRNDRGIPRRCINFVRSVPAPNLECQPGPLEQVNQITHWLDASNVYGSLPQVARSLRTFKDGLLNSIIGDDGQEQLPIDPETTCRGPTTTCALAGDLRVNEQPTLGAMHVLFLREHNRIARSLKEINPRWSDERLYQETRRILGAQWQHIIYNEWLPPVLGINFMKNFGLQPLTQGFSNVYRDDFDPRVTNAFAAAAFRIGHTWIPDVIKTFSTITRNAKQVINLQDVFSDGDVLRKTNLADEIIQGLTIQFSEAFDNNFVNDVTDNLFDDGEFGLDLVAINLQRGRDHGLPGYVKYREICGVGSASSFDDLRSNIPSDRIANLERAYKNVEDIDLFIGAIQEEPSEPGTRIGSTFLCLIGDVFARMRFGDRFFYDNGGQAGSFTSRQLDEIRKASMARLICDNTNIQQVQPLAFRAIHQETNPLTSCVSRLFLRGIPSVDLSVFKE